MMSVACVGCTTFRPRPPPCRHRYSVTVTGGLSSNAVPSRPSAVHINLDGLTCPVTRATAVAERIGRLQDAGKPVHVYGERVNEIELLVGCAATRYTLSPASLGYLKGKAGPLCMIEHRTNRTAHTVTPLPTTP